MAYELKSQGLLVQRQVPLTLKYKGIVIEKVYRIDLLIEDKIVIELKSVKELNDLHFAQLLTYLRLLDCPLGMLMNFNVPLFKNGVKRVANGYID